MKTTLLITTYNWPRALELVLLSVRRQSIQPDEIVIADDGSTNETKDLIDSFRAQFKCNIKHVWHEDLGFTKTIILNKAITEVSSPYIIQIDGDVILHKHFIKNHTEIRRAGIFLFGSRVSLKSKLSKTVLENKKLNFSFLSKGLLRRGRLLYIPILTQFSKLTSENSGKLRGCNMSYWKKDALDINGYDEDFFGWGLEDSNFAQRLLNKGVKMKRLKYSAIQFHIYHKMAPKGDKQKANQIQMNAIKNKVTYCKNGINKQ